MLVVDDSPDIHALLDVRLRPEALTLHHALSGAEGLAMARDLRPDVVLLDVDLPGLSGFEVCRALKADLGTSATPVIFLTGATSTLSKVEGFNAGAVDYVTKPFDAAELRARVRAALRTKRYQDLLATRASVDALTGLGNRSCFDQRLEQAVAAGLRYGRPACLVLLDLDHFKSLNDRFGHPFGDQVLQAVGELAAASVRPTDSACRYGGEEVALILDEADAAAGAVVAERVRAGIAALAFRPRGEPVLITASFGLASAEHLGGPAQLDGKRLVALADAALYRAKAEGRNRTCAA